eukprot:UN4695
MRELPRFFNTRVINKHRADSPTWWKHGIQKPVKSAPDDVFSICMVRDPGYWIQSLARDPSDGTFNEFIPVRLMVDTTGRRYYDHQNCINAGQLFRTVDFDGNVYSDALAVWEATVGSYFERGVLPRDRMVVLRYEDYVFRFEEAVRTLGRRGLELREDHPPFVALPDTAKDQTHPKAAHRDLSTTKRDLSDPAVRYKGRMADQKERLLNVDKDLVHSLGYGSDAVDRWIA